MTGDGEREDQRYLTLAEAAHRYGLSIRTLRRWAENGWLPCVVVAGEMRLTGEHLEGIVLALENRDD